MLFLLELINIKYNKKGVCHIEDFVCKACQNTTWFTSENEYDTGKRIGLYCTKCGAWQKWLNKNEIKVVENIVKNTMTKNDKINYFKLEVLNLLEDINNANKGVGDVETIRQRIISLREFAEREFPKDKNKELWG